MKYYLDQVLKYRFPSKWLATDIGTASHHLLEVLALIKKAKQDGKTTIDDEVFGKEWKIPETLDINLLTEQSFDWHAAKFIQHDWNAKALKDMKKYIKNATEEYKGEYNPLNSNIIDIEKFYEIPLEYDWAVNQDGKYINARGIMDLVVSPEENVLEGRDYKTGQQKDWVTGKDKTYEDFYEDIQLRKYHWAAKQTYPDYDQYLITVIYLKGGGPFTICFSDDDIPKTLELIKKKVEKIKTTQIPRQNKTWKCQKFCDYSQKTFPDGMRFKEFREGQFNRPGETMCLCSQSEHLIKKHGIDYVTNNYKNPVIENK